MYYITDAVPFDTAHFLSAVWGNSNAGYGQTIVLGEGQGKRGVRQIDYVNLSEQSIKDATFDVYDHYPAAGYGIHFRPTIMSTIPEKGRGGRDLAKWLTCIWVDIDGHSLEEANIMCRQFDPPPTFLVASGGGAHAYWLLGSPVDVSDEDMQHVAKHVLSGMSRLLSRDDTSDLAHTLRLPGFRNPKDKYDGMDAQCKVVWANWTRNLHPYRLWNYRLDTLWYRYAWNYGYEVSPELDKFMRLGHDWLLDDVTGYEQMEWQMQIEERVLLQERMKV